MQGFKEEQAAYTSDRLNEFVGQFRRLGSAGPAYEIMAIDENGTVHAELVYNDEKLMMPLAEVLEDPIAQTIP